MFDNPNVDDHHHAKLECVWDDRLGCFVAFTAGQPETHYYGTTREQALANLVRAVQSWKKTEHMPEKMAMH
jgi:hypothetical protein